MMNRNFTIRRFLTDLFVWMVFFSLFVLIPFHPAHSTDTDTAPILTPYSSAQSQQDTPLDQDDRHYRIQEMLHYARTQVPALLPGLPSYVRDPAGWAMNGVRNIRDELGFDPAAAGSPNQPLLAQLTQPVVEMMQTPAPQQGEAMWLSPDYHHMGFLPFHDAMVMGVGMRHAVFDDRVQMQVKPFYGQNWVSLNGYEGAELSANLHGFGIGDGQHPWGKIAVRYIEGDSEMLDHGHGTDLHAELRFTDNLAFHAGVREDGDSSGLGNYAMLRWQLAKLGPPR